MSGHRRALAGRTVLVTRPRRQARNLAQALEKAGARVLCAPMIRIIPPRSRAGLDAALRRLSGFDALVFSSRNAVERFLSRARRRRLPPRVFAVGPETARALRERGIRPAALPEKFDAASLARSMGRVAGLRVLIPRAAAAREELPRILRSKGALVTCVEAYRTVADESGARRLRAAAKRRVDAVAFTSPSTVEKFVAALGAPRAKRLLTGALPVSIGPVTSAALRRLGLRPIQAPQATTSGLMQALSERLSP